jgi:division protein CdvB (Snf7/Vps24/ESCRT-III family)
MKIHRTIIDHENDRVECVGQIGYTHPITKQAVVEEYTVTMTESERLPEAAWTNDDLAEAVTTVLTERGVNRTASVKPTKVEAKAPAAQPAAPVEESLL